MLAVKFAAQKTQKISILSFFENSKQNVKNQNTDFKNILVRALTSFHFNVFFEKV